MGFLVRGNSKLGKDIWTFSIPAITTCPGRSSLCAKICYAARYERRWKNTHKKYEENLRNFNARDMIHEILDKKCKVVRIHVAGDFYSGEYIEEWIRVVDALPDVTFYAYTRSWRNALLPLLNKLSSHENFTMLWSTDPSILAIPPAGRRATIGNTYLWEPSRLPTLRVITCPEQTGKAESCSKCKLCFSPKLRERNDIVIKFLEH